MSNGRRKHSLASKDKVALEAVKGEETMVQLAVRYQARPIQIQAWKEALATGAAGVFSNGQEQQANGAAVLIARLYQETGQLKAERDFLAERSGPGTCQSGAGWCTESTPHCRWCAGARCWE